MYWKYGIALERIGLLGFERQNWESVVRMHLRWIEETAVGGLLLRCIAREVLAAAPGTTLRKFTHPAQPGEPTEGVLVVPYTDGDCNAAQLNGKVLYTPYLQGPCGHIWTRVSRNRGLLPHEILFHELVHALRDVAGHGNSTTPLTGGLQKYGNTEELIAVVVTNIFMSDPSNTRADHVGVRADHDNFAKASPELASSLGFFKSSLDAFSRIEQFCTEDRYFAERLSEVPATFNPVAAYFHDQATARSNSASFRAVVRDILPPR